MTTLWFLQIEHAALWKHGTERYHAESGHAMIFLVAAFAYTLHLISLPPGWSFVLHDFSQQASTAPSSEAIARNGTVAVLLARTSDRQALARRLLIVRANGTRTVLQPQSIETASAFRRFINPSDCMADVNSCPYFERVTLAPDGTPFVTFAYFFSGAYSGIMRAGFLWNGQWHQVPQGKPFAGVGKPYEPGNVSIAAADGATRFAFVGDYFDGFPQEDLDRAIEDRYYMADVSGASYDNLNVALGLGNATAMRGAFVAGFDADLKIAPSKNSDAVAVVWRCLFNEVANAHRCPRSTLGPGIAYGIDSQGEAVGDNEPSVPSGGTLELHSPGFPVLWRSGRELALSEDRGAAYAISDDGVIVGTFSTAAIPRSPLSGFVASAREGKPRARALDGLVQNLAGWHVEAALGVADDGQILVFVNSMHQKRALAVLTPQTT